MAKTGKRDLEKQHLEYAKSRMKLSKFSVLMGIDVERLSEESLYQFVEFIWTAVSGVVWRP